MVPTFNKPLPDTVLLQGGRLQMQSEDHMLQTCPDRSFYAPAQQMSGRLTLGSSMYTFTGPPVKGLPRYEQGSRAQQSQPHQPRMWVSWRSHRPWFPTRLSLAPHGWENNCPMISSGQAWFISLTFSISLPDWRYSVPWGTWNNVSPIGTLRTIVIQDKFLGSNTSSSIVRHHHWWETSMSHNPSQCHLSWQIIHKFQEDNIDNGTGNQLGIGISAAKITTKERSSMIQTGHRKDRGLVDTYFKQWGFLLLTWSSIKLATCKTLTTHLLAQTHITMNQYLPLIFTTWV